ncbi:hypothetical protein Q1695_013367 [Nippostrongylus brasiliensis]|nr:hypothetical protein Q1695_013367 [Nippostrongylus brasiliensis]
MGARALPTAADRLFNWLLIAVRTLVIIYVVLPLSTYYDFLLYVRNTFVYLVGTAPKAHARKVAAIQKQVREWASDSNQNKKKMNPVPSNWLSPIRRHRRKDMTPVHMGAMMDLLEVNQEALAVRVEPMITMGELTRRLIALGYCLPIVPDPRHRTVRDAINGGGLGTSGRKYGMFQHICLSYELVMPDGSLVIASKEKLGEAETQALFYGVPWSEDTLGILVAVTIRIIPIKPYIKLTYTPVHSTEEMQSKLTEESHCRENEFVEGLLFSRNSGVVLRGRFSEGPPRNWGAINRIGRWYKGPFHRHAESILEANKEYTEFVPIRDFFHRHSNSLYWELTDYIPFADNFLFRVYLGWMSPPRPGLVRAFSLHFVNDRLNRNHVHQDVLVPLEHLTEAVDTCEREYEVYPLWLSPYNQPSCPGMIRQRSGRNVLFVNVGVYGISPKSRINVKDSFRRLEEFARTVNGVTVVHRGTEMSRAEFWEMFDSSLYEWLRVKYNCKEAFLDVYDKVRSSLLQG